MKHISKQQIVDQSAVHQIELLNDVKTDKKEMFLCLHQLFRSALLLKILYLPESSQITVEQSFHYSMGLI